MMPNDAIEGDLTRVQQWARAERANVDEQLWATFLLLRLDETITALLAGMAASRVAVAQGTGAGPCLRLVASNKKTADARIAEPVS